MDEVQEVVSLATNNDTQNNIIFVIILALVACVFVLENIKKFKEILGLKNKWEILNDNQSTEINDLKKQINNVKIELDDLKSYSREAKEKRIKFESETTETLKEIRDDMVRNRVDTIRGKILEFGSSCKIKDYTKENFDYILKLADEYHSLLAKYEMSNSQTDMAMEFIMKKYAEYMEKGFPNYQQ